MARDTKSQTIPMQQKGGMKARDTWQSGAPFGDGNIFGIVTPIDKFATYDMPPMALRVLGRWPWPNLPGQACSDHGRPTDICCAGPRRAQYAACA